MIRDPYAATHFEPGCPDCDALWQAMVAASSSPDFEARAQRVTAQVQAHARDAHDLTLATEEGAQ